MRLISAPYRLLAALSGIVLCVPLAALQASMVRAPERIIWISVGVSGAFTLGVFLSVLRGWRWPIECVKWVGLLWSTASLVWALSAKNPSHAFFALGVLVYWTLAWFWLRFESGRTYIDPGTKWYQSVPKPIPGLVCRLAQSQLRVGRIDEEGAFIFNERVAGATKFSAGVLEFQFRNSQVRVRGKPVMALEGARGAGYCFVGLSADEKKDLGDFVEILRGEGHV